MREICYLTPDPIVLLNVFPQFESNLIYGLPSNRINWAPIFSVCFPLACKLKQASSLTPDINCHCVVYILSATPHWFRQPSSGRDREGTGQSCCLLPASMTGVSVLEKMVYGLSLKCFSWEALCSDFTHQGFLSIWNSFTVFCVKNGCLMWDGGPHCWGKHVFKLIPITKHGVWVIHILYPSTLCLWPLCAPLSLGC